MKIEEIKKACFAGKTFTFNNVKIHEFDMSDGVFNIIYSLPSVENQPYCQGFDVKEISVYEPPKYDPCRPFREGDIVTPIARDGREVPDLAPVGKKCTVVEAENNGVVRIHYVAGSEHYIHEIPFYHLELVTPVEELEPYSVHESEVIQGFDIVRDKLCVMTFPFGAKECGWYYNRLAAKEAAEAERDRLNAEYRKEQK